MGKKEVWIEDTCRNDRVVCMWVCGAYPSGKKSSNRVGLYGNIWREYNNQDRLFYKCKRNPLLCRFHNAGCNSGLQ